MYRIFGALLITVGLLTPTLALAQDRDDHHRDYPRYYDKDHHDYHEWNDREALAYHKYYEDQHHEYRDWDRVKKRDQRDYWRWRHNHPDAALQIEVH